MPEIAFQYQAPKKMIDTYIVDAFLAEHYKFSNSVTDIPVEEGGNIADHIVEDQDVISVEAFIGNTAFERITDDGNAGSNLQAPDRMERVRLAYHELKRLTKAKKPLDVVLGLETFTGMVITSFTIDREAETGANLPFAMEFKKIKIVHSDTAKINASNSTSSPAGAGDQTASTINAGTSGTEQPDYATIKAQWRFAIDAGRATQADYEREMKKLHIPLP
jgi:major membrane immunogen (membrane-anchored lipoprotein)